MADGRRSLICSADANFDVRAAANRAQLARNAPQPTVRPAPQQAAPKAQAKPAVAVAASGYKCPASAPVARRFAIRGGGSTVMCTTANGGMDGATPPLALGDRSDMVVPKGYRKAWTDGRLNPNRAKGTAMGQAQQDQIWTRDVPAQLVATAKGRKVVTPKAYVTSTSNAPRQTKPASGRYFVQVGTFGEPANVNRTTARLQGLGLPVAKSRITSKGRNLHIVMAGPFADAGSAKAALSKARRSGFGDAFIR
jgi:cell division septation protein DedD